MAVRKMYLNKEKWKAESSPSTLVIVNVYWDKFSGIL